MSVVSILRSWQHQWSERRVRHEFAGKKRPIPIRKYRPTLESLEHRLAAGSFFNGFGLSLAHALPLFFAAGAGSEDSLALSDRFAATRDSAHGPSGDPIEAASIALLAPSITGLEGDGSSAGDAPRGRSGSFALGSNSLGLASGAGSANTGGFGAPSSMANGAMAGSVTGPSVASAAGGAMPAGTSRGANPGDDLFRSMSAALGTAGNGVVAFTSPGVQPAAGPGGGNHDPIWNWLALKPKQHGPPPPNHATHSGFHLPGIRPFAAPANGVGTPVDASRNIGGPTNDESEEDLAINPTNPSNIFVFANDNNANPSGIVAMTSFDGGNSFSARVIATGKDFPPACCDPSVSFDNFGNLFASYINISGSARTTELLLSTNGGTSFTHLQTFTDVFDQPKLAVGDNTMWIVWTDQSTNSIKGTGAKITGLGQVGSFLTPIAVPSSTAINFGRVAVGPQGQVIQSFQTDPPAAQNVFAPDNLRVSINNGLFGTGGGWSAPIIVGSNNVGFRASAPPLTPDRGAAMFSSVAFDNSNGQHSGRAYIVYMDLPSVNSQQYDIFLRHSDDNGNTWSAPVRVTDDNTGRAKTQPRVAVDPTNGDVAISWLDSRNDNGNRGSGDLDGIPGDEVESFMTFSYDGGSTFEPNIQVATSASSAILNPNFGNDYGDYTGLDFYAGIARPAWADNSTTLVGNLGAPNHFDIATAAVNSVLSPPEDNNEPNDTTDTATNLGTLGSAPLHVGGQTISKHSNGLYDYDNFRLTMGASGTFTATETEEISRGGLELHLFKLQGNTLVDVGDATARTPLARSLSISVSKGDIIYVEAKGRNYAPGRMGPGFYHLDLSVR